MVARLQRPQCGGFVISVACVATHIRLAVVALVYVELVAVLGAIGSDNGIVVAETELSLFDTQPPRREHAATMTPTRPRLPPALWPAPGKKSRCYASSCGGPRERDASTNGAFLLFPWRRWYSGFVISTEGMWPVVRGQARVCVETRPAALPSNCRAREEPSAKRRRTLALKGAQLPVTYE
jgi:hypothetical protein